MCSIPLVKHVTKWLSLLLHCKMYITAKLQCIRTTDTSWGMYSFAVCVVCEVLIPLTWQDLPWGLNQDLPDSNPSESLFRMRGSYSLDSWTCWSEKKQNNFNNWYPSANTADWITFRETSGKQTKNNLTHRKCSCSNRFLGFQIP